MLIDKFSNEITFQYNNKKSNKSNLEFDILLALTIGKIIFDLVSLAIKCYSRNPKTLYEKYKNLNQVDKIIILRVIKNHYPNRLDRKKIREAILSQELSQEDFENLVKEVQNESA